jgi:hypothetical protein
MYNEEDRKEIGHDAGGASGLRRFLSDNTLVITLIVFAFVIMRVLVTTRLNIGTALGVIAQVGSPTVIVNSIVSALGPLLAFLLVLLSLDFNLNFTVLAEVKQSHKRMCWWSLLLPSVLIGPLFFLVFAIGFRILALRETSRSRVEGVPYFLRRLLLVALGASIFAALFLGPMWLPAERIDTGTQENIIGYVLSEKGGWFSVLSERGDRLMYIKAEEIRSRVVCRSNPFESAGATGLYSPLPSLALRRAGRWVDVSEC